MSNVSQNRMIVGLDIGTSKVVAIVGEVSPEGKLEIVGIGSHGSKGLKKGVVVNIDSTVQSIQRAIEEAELMAGCQIQSVYAGIAGSHIRSMGSHGIVAIRDGEVYQPDIERVIDAAQAVAIPADQRFSISCRRNSSLMRRKVLKNRWVCQACGWKQRCTWSPVQLTQLKTLKNVSSSVG